MKKKIVILGAGESGTGAAILAQKEGFDVFVSDNTNIEDKFKEELLKNKIAWEENMHTENKILAADEIIKSPGISSQTPLIIKIIATGIPIISEIEFASRYTKAKMICITGSNGKTTTTLLVYHILKKAGLNVGLAGNIGFSLAKQVAESNFDYYVIELSSFQLDDMYQFKADIAILLNITPDHLDRYEYKMENYIASKFRIINNQTAEDTFIFCIDDDNINKAFNNLEIKANSYPFSLIKGTEQGAYASEDYIHFLTPKKVLAINKSELILKGKHNIYNSMAAGIAGLIMDIKKKTIREALADFINIPHRLEYVATVRNIVFVNDSKATNVNATWYALDSIPGKVVWIAGGIDKGNDYSELYDVVENKVHTLICLGKNNSKLKKAFEKFVPVIIEVDNMQDAVKEAYILGQRKDTVLLSPCCASFDLFKNYEDRGDKFKEQVKKL